MSEQQGYDINGVINARVRQLLIRQFGEMVLNQITADVTAQVFQELHQENMAVLQGLQGELEEVREQIKNLDPASPGTLDNPPQPPAIDEPKLYPGDGPVIGAADDFDPATGFK